MVHKIVTPEDVLPDDTDIIEIEGIKARKGSVAAALANAGIIASDTATEEERNQAFDMFRKIAPVLVALNMHEHLSWKNPAIQAIIDGLVNKKG